jgi:Flp pilus assembly protein TadG
MRTFIARLRADRGQSMVELALVLPICLWLLLGIIDFGRIYFFHVAATNAAREGARYWASNTTATLAQVQARVQAEASPSVTLASGNITRSNPTADQYEVDVQYSFTPFTPMVSNLVGSPLTFTVRAVMPRLTPGT